MSWDDFLPSLSYVIVECNRPHILIEVEYMMELLEPSWLGGEGTTLILRNNFTITNSLAHYDHYSSESTQICDCYDHCFRAQVGTT